MKRTHVFPIVLASGLVLCTFPSLPAADCNANGIEDALDLSPQGFSFNLAPELDLQTPLRVPSFYSLNTSDLDGDGDLDLIADAEADGRPDHDDDSGYLQVYRSLGGGRFETGPTYFHGDQPDSVSLAVIDLDGDGKVDAVPASSIATDHLPVLYGRGDGTFETPRAIAAVGGMSSLAAADLDGDGDIDLASGVGVAIVLIENLGVRQLEKASTIRLPGDEFLSAVGAGDFDGDGDTDLATAAIRRVSESSFGAVISLVPNDGDMKFGARLEQASFADQPSSGLLTRDLNGDARPDLSFTTTSSNAEEGDLHILLNRGGGSFGEPSSTRFRGTSTNLAAADLDGDGDVDLAATVFNGSHVLLFPNGGDGRPGEPNRLATVHLPASLAAGDLDGDARIDLAVQNIRGVLSVLRGLEGGVSPAAPSAAGGDGITDMAAADLDADGLQDLALVGWGGDGVSLLFRRTGWAFLPEQTVKVGTSPSALAVVDLDQDGDPDLAVANRLSDSVSVLRNRGNRSFEDAGTAPAGQYPVHLALGDLDGDALNDMAVACLDRLSFLSGRAGLRFEPDGDVLIGSRPRLLKLADLDADGDLDLAAAGEQTYDPANRGQLAVLLNDGFGSFSPPQNHVVIGIRNLALDVADLDGDGTPDLAAGSDSSNDVSFFRGVGGGRFGEAIAVPAGGPVSSLFARDLDGDGRLDLLAGTDRITVLLGRGGGAFDAPLRLGHDALWTTLILAAQDLDRDGDLDVAAAHTNDLAGTVLLIENLVKLPRSRDADGDGIPDECRRRAFHRGDPAPDGVLDITDPVTVLGYLFLGAGTPACLEAADADGDGRVDLSDPIVLLEHLFRGGPPPAPPGPPGAPCGQDPDPPGSAGDLGCGDYPAC